MALDNSQLADPNPQPVTPAVPWWSNGQPQTGAPSNAQLPIGTTSVGPDGVMVRWNGTSWDPIGNQTPGTGTSFNGATPQAGTAVPPPMGGPAGPPPPAAAGGGGGGGGSYSLMGSMPFDMNPPTPPSGTGYLPTAPTFQAPQYTPPPKFQAPSIDEALSDPAYAGYKFQTDQGETALQNWAAARGTLNDSGTAQSLINYGQNAGRGYYQQLYNNALGAYNTNYQTQYQDPFTNANQGAWETFQSQLAPWQTQAQAAEYQTNATYQDQYQAWLAKNGFRQQWVGDQLAANAGTQVNVGG